MVLVYCLACRLDLTLPNIVIDAVLCISNLAIAGGTHLVDVGCRNNTSWTWVVSVTLDPNNRHPVSRRGDQGSERLEGGFLTSLDSPQHMSLCVDRTVVEHRQNK